MFILLKCGEKINKAKTTMTKPTGAILDFLGADHRACDDFFASVRADVTKRSWAAARRQFGRFLYAMLCHLAREEKVLYPRSKPTPPTAWGRHGSCAWSTNGYAA